MGFKSLVSLETLLLEAFPRLRSVVTKGGLPLMLAKLQIKDCSILKKRCLKDGGKDWLKVAYIPNVLTHEIIRQQGELPTTLKLLCIIGCKSLESLPEGIIRDPSIGSSNTSGLETLRVKECSSLKSIPSGEFPSTLTRLWIWKCNNLESIPGKMLQNLTSLELLDICNCPEIVSSPEAFLTPNLKFLAISDCQNMKRPLSEWGLHTLTSLTLFIICGPFPDVVSFLDDHGSQLFLPTSLKELRICNFQSLKSVASMGLRNLISLEILVLSNCPQLGSVVPKEGLPPTVAELRIVGCPILEKRCLKNKGKDWFKIAHIPKVVIDGIIQ